MDIKSFTHPTLNLQLNNFKRLSKLSTIKIKQFLNDPLNEWAIQRLRQARNKKKQELQKRAVNQFNLQVCVINQFVKVVARIMKPYQSEEKIIMKQTPKKTQQILKIEQVPATSFKSDLIEVEELICSGQKEDPNEKFSMSKLCQAFIQRCNQNQSKIFQTKVLVEDFGVKQRRIYDLMNIMEGCGCLKKLSKGRYQWIGVQNSEFINPESQKGDSTSLRQIAARIKLLFSQTKGIISFGQINQLLLAQNKQRSINPSSIRRRIYECCKVLRILGFIQKLGKHYQWIQDKDNIQHKQLAVEARKSNTRRLKRQQLTQPQLINEILKRYTTVQKINEFIDKLTSALNASRQIKKQQAIYEQCQQP